MCSASARPLPEIESASKCRALQQRRIYICKNSDHQCQLSEWINIKHKRFAYRLSMRVVWLCRARWNMKLTLVYAPFRWETFNRFTMSFDMVSRIIITIMSAVKGRAPIHNIITIVVVVVAMCEISWSNTKWVVLATLTNTIHAGVSMAN